MVFERLVAKHRKSRYDFLDLGCKTGGSIAWCQARYGGKGLGVDMDEQHIKKARASGHNAVVGDVLKLDFPENTFRYVSMMDFLEHLPDEQAVKQVLANCKKWAKGFFFIHHPSFEDVDYLKKLGLKIDWTDGWGHTSPLTIKDFKRIFKELGLKDYKIERKKPINDSTDRHILPLSAPSDTVYYNHEIGPKKKVTFDKPVYSRVEILVNL